jgi:two-component system, OmpR family, response regulator
MRVLVVEDEPSLREGLVTSLRSEGYTVLAAADGREGLYLGETEAVDAVVLDLGLPLLDGLSVLQRWRQQGLTWPVMILTARDSWHDKVTGMDAGADDYLAKPFHVEELLARLRALIRRSHGLASTRITVGDIELDTRQARASVGHQPLNLTAQEFRILSYLMHHGGEVVSRTELIDHVYDSGYDNDSNTIEVFIARLRKKLPADCIQTVRGMGYRLVDPRQPSPVSPS